MSTPPAARAGRLLRWYPKAWRARYGDEFAALLVSELSEQPRSWRRTLDVAANGSLTRLTYAGLRGNALDPADQIGASLAVVGYALAGFLAFGAAMWSQLTIGWRWSRPDTTATEAGMVVMCAAVAALLALAVLAAVPIGWSTLRRIVGGRDRVLLRPAALFAAGTTVLVVGARHFENGWPGTGGHPWAHQGLVPGGLAAFTWASTLSVSSYWAHPGALGAFPAAEVAWMAISPAAIIALTVGAARTVRRLDLAPGILRYEARLAALSWVAMLAFLLGGCLWIVDGGPGPRNLFHAGVIDGAGLAVMVAALAVAYRAVARARATRPAA